MRISTAPALPTLLLVGIYAPIIAVNQADATLITSVFSGTVAVNDPSNLLGGTIASGDRFSGTFKYDLSAQDNDPSPNSGNYQIASPPGALSIQIAGAGGPITYSNDPSLSPYITVNVVNNQPSDFFSVSGFGSASTFPFYQGLPGSLIFNMTDPMGVMLTSDGLPTTLDISGNPSAFFVVDANSLRNGTTTTAYQITGSVDVNTLSLGPSGQAHTIPEPGTLLLIGGGLAAMSYTVKKRNKCSS